MSDVPSQTLAQTLTTLQTQGLERLDAQLLLLHVLGKSGAQRGWLLAHDTDLLPETSASRLNTMAQRRVSGEPLAYLTGSKAFYGLDLSVNSHVLVPRPDSETLVDWALAVLTNNAATQTVTGTFLKTDTSLTASTLCPPTNRLSSTSVLDLGTGSGAIALALKVTRPDLRVWATDMSVAALAVAQANAQRLQLDLQFSRGPWFAALPPDTSQFDCIVSNPPYIAEHDPHLTALGFEPAQALTSGIDGLDDLRQIISNAPAHLKTGGWLLLEHGHDQAAAVCDLLARSGFAQVQSRRDLAGIERCSGGQKPHQTP
jgi:release factor glutamine methyltransferase